MMNSEEMSKKVEELVAGGMSMKDALAQVIEENKPVVTGRTAGIDRIALMATFNNLAELRKAIKIAFAKKSKADKGSTAYDRYEQEIKAGQARQNELIAQINAADDKLAKAIELGEDESGVIQYVLAEFEKGLEEKLNAIQQVMKKTNKEFKELVNASGTDVPEVISNRLASLSPVYLKTYKDRAGRSDQRVLTLNKRLNFLANTKAKAEAAVAQDQPKPEVAGDVNPEPEAAPEQTTPATTPEVTPEVKEQPAPENKKNDKKNRR